jgi:hypothetical protein
MDVWKSLVDAKKFAELWECYFHREELFPDVKKTFKGFPKSKYWKGEKVNRLALAKEQGCGDQIMFSRWLQELECEVTMVTYPAMQTFFERQDYVDNTCALGLPKKYDAWCSLLDLPHLLNSKQTHSTKYIKTSPIIKIDKSKINNGVCWAGNPAHACDFIRSCQFERFQPIIDLPNTMIFSLVTDRRPRIYKDGEGKEIARRDLSKHPQEWKIQDCSPYLSDWFHTACLINELDAVVAVDTSVAHCAGALGIPTAIVLSEQAEWRWGSGYFTCWYDSARLFRQEKLNEWLLPITKAAEWLKELVDNGCLARLRKAKQKQACTKK